MAENNLLKHLNRREGVGAETKTIPRWEYMLVERMSFHDLDDLQALGFEGWEMCGAMHDTFYFKRPLPPHTVREFKGEQLVDFEWERRYLTYSPGEGITVKLPNEKQAQGATLEKLYGDIRYHGYLLNPSHDMCEDFVEVMRDPYRHPERELT